MMLYILFLLFVVSIYITKLRNIVRKGSKKLREKFLKISNYFKYLSEANILENKFGTTLNILMMGSWVATGVLLLTVIHKYVMPLFQ